MKARWSKCAVSGIHNYSFYFAYKKQNAHVRHVRYWHGLKRT